MSGIAWPEQSRCQEGGGRCFCRDRRSAKGNEVSVNGAGKFKIKATSAREGRNRQAGETI